MNKPFLGVAYYPEDWDESDMPHDIEKMKQAGITVARIGEFAWRKMEPRQGEYDFSWLHRVVDALGANGIKTVMGTPTATPPIWLIKQHPEVAYLGSDGVRKNHGGRRHCCSNAPAYIDSSREIVTAMAREFAHDKNIVGWQIDNEIYSWDGCCCEFCVNKFHRYLEEKYGTIEELNRAWNLNVFSQAYDSFGEIPPAVNAWHNPHIIYEWKVFHQLSNIEFINMQAEILKKYVSAPIGTDMMPFNGLDYEKTVENLDVVMFNHYNDENNLANAIFWFDYLRTLKNTPFWNTETQTSWNGSSSTGQVMKPEGFCRLNSWLPVILGGEANMYWLFRQHHAGHELLHGALLYPSGKPFHIFGEVQQTAFEFEKAAEFISDTRVQSDTALLFTSKNWNLFETQRILNDFSYCERLMNDFHKPLIESGIVPDVIGAKKELSEYRLIFAPYMMTLEDGGLQGRLEKWVRNGGVLVAGPMCDIRNALGAHYRDADTGMLEKLTGCTLDYSIPDSSVYIKSQWTDGTPFTGKMWHELYTSCDGAQELVSVTGGHSAVVGKAVVTKVKLGKGEIILLGSIPSEDDIKKLIGIAAADAGVIPFDISGSVIAVPRKGENYEGLILAEYKNQGGTCILPRAMTDVLTGDALSGKITLTPYEIRILQI